ncbi:hypothetical protein ABIE62_000450 [Porphyrobacter sp. MBR-155]|jgi:hypothetical protein|uniref:hypothetical protein n=1 Tax=Porphyrobacter sp. MBR-155 TaxID=3156464 RepID=UPI003395EEA9
MKVYPPKHGESNQQWFAELANPHHWLLTADNLFEQCVRLNSQKGRGYLQFNDGGGKTLKWDVVDRSMFLLGGFALENAIKAFLVYENPNFVADGRLARELRSHRLIDLKNRSVLIPMPKRSELIIAVFEEGIETWSRYPCGLTAQQSDMQRWFTPQLWTAYCGLMRRYGRKLKVLLEKGWKGPHKTGGSWSFQEMSYLDIDSVSL